MSLLASEILTTLRQRGVRFLVTGGTLTVDAPAGVLKSNERKGLVRLRAEILEAVKQESETLKLSPEAFRQQDTSQQVYVPWLGETVWLVPHSDHREEVVRDRADSGHVFTAHELTNLTRLRQLAGSDDVAAGDINQLIRLKIAFGAEIQSVESESENNIESRPPNGTHNQAPPRCLFLNRLKPSVGEDTDSLGLPILSDQERKIIRLRNIFISKKTKELKMDIHELYSGNFLKVEDLKNHHVPVEIANFEVKEIGIDADKKGVLSFKDKLKKLVLNKTNADRIAAAYGAETDEWVGRRVTLYPDEAIFRGKLVPCIRVRTPSDDVEDERPFAGS